MSERDDTERSVNTLIRNWQTEESDNPTSEKRGVWAVVIGGGVVITIPGGVVGAMYIPELGITGFVLFGVIGAILGAFAGAFLGLLVGVIGELIAGKLGLDRRLRTKLGYRLNSFRGGLLYGGMVGAIGGSIVNIPLRFQGFGADGPLSAAVMGLVIWMLLGVVGGTIDWSMSRYLNAKQRYGKPLIAMET